MLLLTLLLQGCLQPVALPEIHKYQLCTPTVLRCTPCAGQTLYISLPQAMGPYNTTQMIYSQCPYQISSFAEHRWAMPLPQMLLPLIVDSLRNANHFKVVGFPTIANSRYRLDTSIVTFRQEFCRRGSQVHIILDATLIYSKTQKVIAARRIEVIVPTLCRTPESAVKAYQCALNSVLKQLKWFILANSIYPC